MLSRIGIKRIIKRAAGFASVAAAPFVRTPRAPRVCILMYHRVADVGFVDPDLDNWNVSPAVFSQQIEGLLGFAEFVRLGDIAERLYSLEPAVKPLVCVTFDDGYAGCFAHALPVLLRHRVPATIFVVTRYIGSSEPMPFDRWGQKHRERVPEDAWRTMSWEEVRCAVQTGLVSVGSHSDQHLDGRLCNPTQLMEEAEWSRALLRDRLDDRAGLAYAYPYGCTRLGEVPTDYVAAVRKAGYEIAVSTDLGLADRGSDLYRLPRVEAYGLDTPAVIRAKVRGSLAPLFLTDRLRRANRG